MGQYMPGFIHISHAISPNNRVSPAIASSYTGIMDDGGYGGTLHLDRATGRCRLFTVIDALGATVAADTRFTRELSFKTMPALPPSV